MLSASGGTGAKLASGHSFRSRSKKPTEAAYNIRIAPTNTANPMKADATQTLSNIAMALSQRGPYGSRLIEYSSAFVLRPANNDQQSPMLLSGTRLKVQISQSAFQNRDQIPLEPLNSSPSWILSTRCKPLLGIRGNDGLSSPPRWGRFFGR